MVLSQTEAEQLNALRELLIQSERHPQGPSAWEKMTKINKSIGLNSLGFTGSILELCQTWEDALTDPSLDNLGDLLYTSFAKPFVNLGSFFEGLF